VAGAIACRQPGSAAQIFTFRCSSAITW
jgi:hypothetical protein